MLVAVGMNTKHTMDIMEKPVSALVSFASFVLTDRADPCVVLNIAIEPFMPLQLFVKDDRASHRIKVDVSKRDRDEAFSGIRCPLCKWRPLRSSLWYCLTTGTPEPFFEGCGTEWNTFSTRGRCPGCSHQWRWTSCLRCSQWSKHEDWYGE